MSETDKDFLTGMMAQAPAAESAPVVDEVTESDVPETVETPVVEPVATAPNPEPAAVAPTAPPAEKTVPLAALESERKKRQEYEKRLKDLEAKPTQPAPNFYDNPEAHLDHRFQDIEARAQGRVFAALEYAAKAQHSDYDEVAAEVIEAAQSNPAIVQTVMQAANPAMAMYEQGMKLRQFREMQDPEAYRAKIAAEIREQVIAELGGRAAQAQREAEARAAKAEAIPPDISNRTSATPKGGATVTNPVNVLFPKH
jgi:hypothetical protein